MKWLIGIIVFCLCSCTKQETIFYGEKFGIPYKVIVFDRLSAKEKTRIRSIIEKAFSEADRIYNHWNPQSEISHFNLMEKNVPFACCPTLMKLFYLADELHHLSNTRFDPSLGKLIAEWKSSLSKGHFLDPSSLDHYQTILGWSKIAIKDSFVVKSASELYIDFDSIAKGFLVDSLYALLEDTGFKSFFIEWGGEIKAKGKKGNTPWKIGIQDPIKQNAFIGTYSLENKACATSGIYEQKWTIQGVEYTHLINRTTLYPIQLDQSYPLSVTVFASSCAWADGLATIACLMPDKPSLMQWTKKMKDHHPDIEFIILYPNDPLENNSDNMI